MMIGRSLSLAASTAESMHHRRNQTDLQIDVVVETGELGA
jgi:hypothetical protein